MSANRPWFAVARGVFSHDVVRRGPLCEVAAWLHLVSLANYADNPTHDPPLLRGQACTTAGKLAAAWGWKRSRVKSEIARWERAGMLATTGVGRATIYTVTGFEQWQSVGQKPRTNCEPTTNQPRTNHEPNGSRAGGVFQGSTNQPRTNHEPVTNQSRTATTRHEDTKTRKTDDRSPATPSILSAAADHGASNAPDTGQAVEPIRHDLATKAGRSRAFPPLSRLAGSGRSRQYPAAFTAFRDAYPCAAKKAPPADTYKAWRAVAVESAESMEAMQRAASAYAAHVRREGTPAKYVKGAAAWIRAERWVGEADAPTNTGASQHTKPEGQQDRWREIASRHDLSTEEGQAAALSEGFGGLRIMRGGEINDDEIDF